MNKLVERKVLETDWYVYKVAHGVDVARPGIYEWHIEGVGYCIGQYTHIHRPTKEYGRNVTKKFDGRPYRKSNWDGFRLVHRELHRAICDKRTITLTILLNADKPLINTLERELSRQRGVLNRLGPLTL